MVIEYHFEQNNNVNGHFIKLVNEHIPGGHKVWVN